MPENSGEVFSLKEDYRRFVPQGIEAGRPSLRLSSDVGFGREDTAPHGSQRGGMIAEPSGSVAKTRKIWQQIVRCATGFHPEEADLH